MKGFFLKWAHHCKILFGDSVYCASFVGGAMLLLISNAVNQLATVYNDSWVYISATDILIDSLPVVNMEFLYTWGMYFLTGLIIFCAIFLRLEMAPFTMKTVAVLMFLRSGFILLTNIGPPLGFIYEGAKVGGNVLSDFLFRNDLFFSGHVAYPFLAFWIFRDIKWASWIFLIGTIVQSVTVLFMHVHYSIDVFAAYFVTYGVYKFSEYVFARLNLRFKNRLKMYGLDVINKFKEWKQ